MFYSKRKPQKNGTDKPLYDYQRIIFDVLVTQNGNVNSSNKKHLWIKKATGVGISEFMLRFMAWLSLKDNKLKGIQIGLQNVSFILPDEADFIGRCCF